MEGRARGGAGRGSDPGNTHGPSPLTPLLPLLQASEAVPLSQRSIDVKCDRVLTGHTGAVHALLAHTDGVLSCAADGTVRCWKAGGSTHTCLREVALSCGPVYGLVPMGRQVWAAGADGVIHTLDGTSLEASGPPRHAHAGFVSGLCSLQARTTRQLWSFSTSDSRVCRWKLLCYTEFGRPAMPLWRITLVSRVRLLRLIRAWPLTGSLRHSAI